MKVIYYQEEIKCWNMHANNNYWYIPDKKVVLKKERETIHNQLEDKHNNEFLLYESESAINKVIEATECKKPKLEGITYSNIKELDLDERFIDKIIKDLRVKQNLETVIEKNYSILNSISI
jgi:hypothetical protein